MASASAFELHQMAVQAEALQVVDKIVARRNDGEQVPDQGGAFVAGFVILVAHAI